MNYFKQDYLLFIITNQSGVARKFYDIEDIKELHHWMLDVFKAKQIIIDDIYYCPHHPDFDLDCDCRKPKPGMLLKAKEKFNLDMESSILIGDSDTDLQAGKRAGIKKLIKVNPNDLSNVKDYISNES